MAISLGGSRVGGARGGARGSARLGARTPVRAGALLDTVLLGLSVVGAVVLLALPGELRDRTAATLRRTAVAPLVEMQRLAEVQRAKYLSYDDRMAERGALARDAADVTGLRAENDRLRRMLGLGARLQWGFVTAEAIPNQKAGELARQPILLTVMLTQGSRAGVAPFAPVVAPGGLVGMVEQVDPATSMAITYAHADFRVSAQTPDGTAFGIVQPYLVGTGADRALLEMRGVPFRSPLRPGQLVVSSGQGGTYPRGIPIGTVVREIQTPERWARTYLLQPAVDLADVGAVMVVRQQRSVAGVDSVWTSIASADSAARRVAAAGDSIARDALLREAAARRAAFDSTQVNAPIGDSARVVVPAPNAPAGGGAPAGGPSPATPAPNGVAAGGGTGAAAGAVSAPRPTVPRSPATRSASPTSEAPDEAAAPRPAAPAPARPTVPPPAVPRPTTDVPTGSAARSSADGERSATVRRVTTGVSNGAVARPTATTRTATPRTAASTAASSGAATRRPATGRAAGATRPAAAGGRPTAPPRADSARRRPAGTGARPSTARPAPPRPTVPAARPNGRPAPAGAERRDG